MTGEFGSGSDLLPPVAAEVFEVSRSWSVHLIPGVKAKAAKGRLNIRSDSA